MSLYSERVAQDSPLFYFENNSSGVNNTGSITPTIVTGSLTAFTSSGGVQNSPYMVNAGYTGEYGFEYSNSTTIFDDKTFSITGWAYLTSSDLSSGGISGNRYIFHTGTSANGIVTSGNSIYATFNGGTTIVSGTITLNQWVHYAVTVDTTNTKLYINGSLVSTAATPSTISMDSQVKYWMRETTSGTPRRGMQGKFDEWAVFNTTLSATTIQEHYNAGFGVDFHATAVTASALAVDPAVSYGSTVTATPLTASAASGDHYNSTRDSFTLLDGYMGTLSLEQWYKFDDVKNIINYGSGGNAAFFFSGNATSEDHGGIQGSGALRICGNDSDGSVAIALDDYTTMSPELTDGDFSIGFWLKAPSAVANNPAVVFGVSNYNDGTFTDFIIHDSGKLEFQMYTNTLHGIETASSICDNNWHLVVGKYDGSTMSFYVDNTLIGTETVNSAQYSPPNTLGFGTNSQAANGNFFSVSNFFISSSSAITTTVMGNMITYSDPKSLQAYANMEPAKFSSNNSFNNLTETRGALVDLRFNEASGSPANYGATTGINLSVTGAVTYNQISPNTKAYKITSTNTKISTVANYPSGTFSTNNDQTLMVYAKVDSGSEPSVINIFAMAGHFGGQYGCGLGLFMLGSGKVRARLRDGAGSNTIDSAGSYADSKYHLYTATTDGSTVKLYIDGILEGSISTTKTLTDSGLLMIGGEGDTFGLWDESKSTYIDEVSVYNSAFTAEQVFNHFQALSWPMDWTATAALPAPAVSAGYGPTITATALTATASMGPVFPPIAPATANGLFQQPNFEAIKNTNNAASPMTASAQAENPGWDIGENNQVLHMDASASFPNARVLIPGFWNADPAIANPAEIVQPTLSTTLGALIKPQSLNANAFFALPPAYYLVTDDMWYEKLVDVDYQSDEYEGVLTFFNTSNNIYLAGSYQDWTAQNNRSPLHGYYGYNMYDSPLPVASANVYDNQNRKALNLRNIALSYQDRETYSGGWTMETMFRTSKKNQFIAGGQYLGDTSNPSSRSKRTGIRLKDGKVAFTEVKDRTEGFLTSADPIAFTGFKDIADGQWHHIIIQYRNDGVDANKPRMQVWIDGKLDIQRFGYTSYLPNQIGFNSNDVDAYSDFDISAISINKKSYVLEREVIINYLAAIHVVPFKAPVATATAVIGEGSKATGNRPRALMLYFWPTSTEQIRNLNYANFTSNESSDELQTIDYYTSPPQEYEGWDVFPVDITGRYVSDLVKPEAYGVENIRLTTFSSYVGPLDQPNTKRVLINDAGTFKDPVTDAARYIDLINDIDLSKFDMIFFKNYPNDPQEKDAFTGNEVVDAYFNLRESKLFEDFLKSLRAAVDTGLSLMVANAQLALDLKIVDRVETVPDMDDDYGSGYSDPYAPTQMFDNAADAANLPTPPQYSSPLGWKDTWKNNRTRIVNIHPGITDYPALVKTQTAFWQSTDEYRWGGADRMFNKYEHKDALAVGDEFVISTTGKKANNNLAGYLATPFANVKAGKIITAFANTIRRGLDLIDNPYKNYAQSIILEPGDVLDGRQVGGRIYVNFTEEINKCQETGSIELISDYWVNYAYENGAITAETRDELLAAEYNQNTTPYWSLNGMNLLQQAGTEYELDTDFEKAGVQKKAIKTRKVNKNGGLSFQSVPSGSVFFSSTYSWRYPMANFEVPSMPTRGFRWLSNREILEGTVIRPTAFAASATMPNALAVPDKVNNFVAQPMLATARLEETQFSSGTKRIAVLPATANATIVKPGSTIAIPVMIANAAMFTNSRAKVASEDQVVLQIIHVDPILYIREDVIK